VIQPVLATPASDFHLSKEHAMKPSRLKSLGAMLCLATGLAACAGSPTSPSTGEFIDDRSIGTRVKTALIRDDEVRARNIEVETFKGKVQLSGFVDSHSQKERAAQLASTVPGVKSVHNEIVVKDR
jgi:hyperosmotically inducible periplasmic protein